MKDRTFYAMTGFGVLMVFTMFAGRGVQQPGSSNTATAEIDKNVYQPYSRSFYPKTFEQWGDDWVKRIDKARIKAAERAAMSPECDRVEVSELADAKSTIQSSIVIFVDCRNSKRFYFAESDLGQKAKAPAVSKQKALAGFEDWQATRFCKEAIPPLLNYPGSFDPHDWFGTSVYRAPSGNIVVTVDFEAMNGFGAKLPHTARCVIDERGLHTPEISLR